MRPPLIVIPARLASTRLPRKPLADINGEPMIVQVWRRAIEARLGAVLVACAETEIAEVVRAAGGEAILTDPDHPSGSDRVHEAVQRYDPARNFDRVINLQGDLPAIDPTMIARAAIPLADRAVEIATLITPIHDPREHDDPNVVKAVVTLRPAEGIGRALYFSRAAVPYGEGARYHHIGIYAYQRAALDRFVSLPTGELERRERLEQLRALENGMRIDAALVDTLPLGVDTPADLERIRQVMAKHAPK